MRITYHTSFTQIPNNIVRSHVLTPSQKVVLIVLCSYANDNNVAYPSYQTIADDSGISRRKAIDVINELAALRCIRKTKRQNGKGDNTANDYEVLIGSANFALPGEPSAPRSAHSSLPCGENSAPGGAQNSPNLYPEKNIKDSNNIHQSINDIDLISMRIKENIDYIILISEYSQASVDEVVGIITDAICGNSPTLRIAGSDLSRECVRSRFMKLNCEHIRYVLDSISKNTTKVRNIKAYMLTALYNAPVTIDSYYTTAVNHDMHSLN